MNEPYPYPMPGMSSSMLLDASADDVCDLVERVVNTLAKYFWGREPGMYYDHFRVIRRADGREIAVTAHLLRNELPPPSQGAEVQYPWLAKQDENVHIEPEKFWPPVHILGVRLATMTRPCRLNVLYEHCPEIAERLISTLIRVYGMKEPEAPTPALRQQERQHGMNVDTEAKVKSFHAKRKAGASYRKAEQDTHCDTDTYRRWCKAVTGEEPIERTSKKSAGECGN